MIYTQMKKILLWMTALLAAMQVAAQENGKGIQFMDNEAWEKVVKAAGKQNKLIFVDCYTTWCGPCRQLSRDVFPREDVGNYVNDKFVSVKYDVERGEGLNFAKKYREQITAFPTLLLINTEGKVLHRIVGYFPAETILQAIKDGVEGRTWQAMEKEYPAKKKDHAFIMNYLNALATGGEGDKYSEVRKAYVRQFPLDSLMNKDIWELASYDIKDPRSKEFQFVLSYLGDFARRGFDRYDLEWMLSINIYYVFSDIIDKGFRTEAQDTVAQMMETLQFLDTMLQADVKGFPRHLACVRVEESYLAKDAQQMFDRLLPLGELGLLDNLKWEKKWIAYLIDNLSAKEQIKRCVDYLYGKQQAEEKGNDWVVEDCYGIIAKGYAKLGEQAKADEFLKKSELLEKQNKEKMSIFE